VIPGLRGTAELASDGQWNGYYIDIARAISEQLTGSADRLALRPAANLSAGLQDVQTGFADLGVLGSTNTISRDVSLSLDFSRPYLVDVQGLLVKGRSSASQLAGQTIGVLTGSTARVNALSFLASQGITASVREFGSIAALTEALRSDAIAAIATDRTRLLAYQELVDGSTILNETFSPQPLAVALPQNQSSLKDAVNWIVETPAAAERLGLRASDLPDLLAQAERGGSALDAIAPQVRTFLELGPATNPAGSLGKAIGLVRGFTQKVLARLGNASELWKRHFPNADNGERNTAAEGGLLRPLPFLGEGGTDPLVANDDRGDLLTLIRERGVLQVATGGSAANVGFSAPDGQGGYRGVDADLARALAIAVLGDASKVAFNTELSFAATFAAVANGSVDVALRASTANLWRDGSFGVDFSDSYLQTGLKILTRTALGVSRIDQLNGASIGVIAGSTAPQGLRLAMARTGSVARIVAYENATALYQAFRQGELDAIARDGALLAGFQRQLQQDTDAVETTLLSGQFSDEPLAAVVDENQSRFLDLVNAVIAILKQAAALGVTAATVDARYEQAVAAGDTGDAAPLRNLFQLDSNAALPALGLTPERIRSMLATTGNMEEIVQRSIANADQNALPLSEQLLRPL